MEKMNLIDIFRQVEPGTKFKSLVHGDITFSKINTGVAYPLVFWSEALSCDVRLSDRGQIMHDVGECIIQPENGESWNEFQMKIVLSSLKDGDIIVTDVGRYDEPSYNKRWISIYDAQNSSADDSLHTYCDFDITKTKLNIDELLEVSSIGDEFLAEPGKLSIFRSVANIRKATDDECHMLRKAISHFGYVWNKREMILEEYNEDEQLNDDCEMIECDGDDFKTFDKVLVRNGLTNRWEPRLFGQYIHTQNNCMYETIEGMTWTFCIPYNEKTKQLAYTTFQWTESKL